jgi:hypothetical protein
MTNEVQISVLVKSSVWNTSRLNYG